MFPGPPVKDCFCSICCRRRASTPEDPAPAPFDATSPNLTAFKNGLLNPSLSPPFNVAEYFVDRNVHEGRGEKIAIECGEERVTYNQLLERVNRTGNALKALGTRPEERVMLLLPDAPEFAYGFFGTIKMGGVAAPINTLLKLPDYEYLLNDTRAGILIVSEPLWSLVSEIPRHRVPCLREILVIRREPGRGIAKGDGTPAAGAQWFDEVIPRYSSELAAEPTHPNDSAFWLYSSGSTGSPKGCVHLHHDMVVTSELYAKQILGVTERDRFFSVAKLFFAYGLGNGLYFPMAVGGTSILWPGAPQPRHIFDIVERHRPTLLFSVPSNFAALQAHEGQPDFSSVRYAVSAGEALPAAIYSRFRERFGVEILDAIGSTEALHMFIANRPGRARPGSSGEVIPGMEARIVDEHGNDVARGETGNLFIKSDALCAFYWKQHEKNKETFFGPWLRTGDKYYQDEDGYFWYIGRSDDMLKVSGAWVSPIEIENTLVLHPQVLEAAVVGREDGDQLTKPAAYVVLRSDSPASEELAHELQEFVRERLPVFKRPRWVEFVSVLPKTATGKIQRFQLRQRD